MSNELVSEIIELDLHIRQGNNPAEKYEAYINLRYSNGKFMNFTIENIWQILFELNASRSYGVFGEGEFGLMPHRSNETVLTLKRT